jgi:hypothetical protein
LEESQINLINDLAYVQIICLFVMHFFHFLLFFTFLFMLKRKLFIQSQIDQRLENKSIHNSDQSAFNSLELVDLE